MNDLKYLAAFSIPFMACVGVYFQGAFSFLVPLYAFVFLPIVEMLFPIDERNLAENEINSALKNKLFDWLLYLNLPIVFGLVIYTLNIVATIPLETYEFFGLVFSIGIVLSINGINVAHELGHRQSTDERFLGKA